MSIVTGPSESTVTDPTGSLVAPTDITGDSVAAGKVPSNRMPLWRLLLRDPMATVAAGILAFVLLVACFGPWLVGLSLIHI